MHKVFKQLLATGSRTDKFLFKFWKINGYNCKIQNVFLSILIKFLDILTREYIKEHNPKLPWIFDHPYSLIIIGCSGSRKTNILLNLLSHQLDFDKTYLYQGSI